MAKKFFGASGVAIFVFTFSIANASDPAELERRVEALENKPRGLLGGVELYGSLRPSLRFSSYDGDGDDETDLEGNLSRLGVRGGVDIGDGWSAFYRGEWKVDIGGDDDDSGAGLGDARHAYVGFGTPLVAIAFGQQDNTYYNIAASVTDIYQHASSPFGWDFNGPFRTPSMLTYSHNVGNLNIQAGGRFNGRGGSHRHAEELNVGISYQFDSAYLGVAFRNTQGEAAGACREASAGGECPEIVRGDSTDTDWWAVGGSANVGDRLYLAFTYQDGEQDDGEVIDDGSPSVRFDDADKSSLDFVASYDFGNGWSGIAGYFDSEDDSDPEGNYDGYNVTVIKSLNSNVAVWGEWLSTDSDDEGSRPYYPDDSVQIGFQYDFSTG